MLTESFASAVESQNKNRWKGTHRMPAKTRSRTARRIGAVMVAVLLGGNLVPNGAENGAQPVAEATMQSISVADRGSTVDRSARVVLAAKKTTKKQRIEKAITFAKAQRGERYRWGAAGPTRWDCSGLVMKAFAKAGKKLPHQTGGIQKKGIKVSKKNMKRGDIVFPQRGHVGIYLGGGKMIHASSGKGKVVIAKVYGFYTARRVI